MVDGPALSPELQSILNRVVHPQFGIIRDMREIPRYPDGPPIVLMAAQAVQPTRFRDPPRAIAKVEIWGAGAHPNREQSVWAALGESLERYAAAIYFDDELFYGTEDEVPGQVVPVANFILYDDSQYETPGFPFRRYNPHVPRRWTTVTNLRNGEEQWVPADLVCFNFDHKSPDEALLQSCSTGFASGRTYQQAMRSAIHEVVERDAFVSYWTAQHGPTRIVIDDWNAIVQDAELADFLNKGIVDASLFWLRNEFDIPCVVALVKPATRNIAVFGGSAHYDPMAALRKATMEGCHSWAHSLDLLRDEKQISDPRQVHTFRHHSIYYLNEDNFGHLGCWFEGGEVSQREYLEQASKHQHLGSAIEAIMDRGFDVFVKDLTTRDLEDVDFVCVRAIIPGLQPLNAGYSTVNRDSRRIRQYLNRWGKADQWEIAADLPPHPFP